MGKGPEVGSSLVPPSMRETSQVAMALLAGPSIFSQRACLSLGETFPAYKPSSSQNQGLHLALPSQRRP